jgi:hypothetical protein
MKKITLLVTILLTSLSFGQIKSIKTAASNSVGCTAGGTADVQYPADFDGASGCGGCNTGNYIGDSGTAAWTYSKDLEDGTNSIQRGEIIFLNAMAAVSVNSILSIKSVTGGGLSTANFSLVIAGKNGVTTDQDETFCTAGDSGSGKKIRFNLVKDADYVLDGNPVTITLEATDTGATPIVTQDIEMTITPLAPTLSTNNVNNFNFTYGPNPTSDIINVSAAKTIEVIEIFNFSGQQVISQAVNETNATLNIVDLAPGIYLMSVTIDGAKETHKIIKE